jgi:hypothetical protein
MSFSAQDAQLAFAVLGAASCTSDASSNLLQPLLLRASTSTAACPLLLALRDMLLKKYPQNGSASSSQAYHQQNSTEGAQALVNAQLQQYETELKDSERQCEPLRIARDKLKAELQRVETLLGNAEAASRRANDGVLVCRSLLQSLAQNSERGFDATVPSTIPSQHQHQHTTSSSSALTNNQHQLAGQSSSFAANQQQHHHPQHQQPSIPAASSTRQQQYHEDPQPQQYTQSPQPQPPVAVNNNNNNSGNLSSQQIAQQAQQQAPKPPAPLTIEAIVETLRKCQQQGRDDEFRLQLIPGLARVERRISIPGTIIDASHAELTSTIMSSVHVLHVSVQVHALRAVLAILRKVAEDPNAISPSANASASNPPSPSASSNNSNNNNSLSSRLYRAGLTSCTDEQGLRTFISLFAPNPNIDPSQHVPDEDQDDVKAEVLECLGVVVGEPHFVEVTTNLGIVQPLVHLIATSTSEPVLERALLLFWSLAQASDRVKEEALQAGAVRALVDLLYTDSIPILDNTMISLGYMSREDKGRYALAENGGLEKMVSSLYHPNASVVIKAAGVVWNAAVIDSNRTQLRSLGSVPALLQLLRTTKSELAQENIAGALWNLTIDAEAKKQVADYEGLQLLVALLNNPESSENILENVTGTLWNCSATIDNRAALRRHGALVPLLRLLQHSAVRIQENAASAIRNLVINDHNKVAVRESGGIEMIVSRLEQSWSEVKMNALNNNLNNGNNGAVMGVIDKLATTLWILTVTPENRQRLQPALGLLLDFVGSDLLSVQTREKVIGTLRNCGGFQANRKPLVQLGAFAVISNFAASLGLALPTDAIPSVTNPPVNTSITLRENIAFTIWHLAREDRDAGRKSGALGVVTALLGDKNDNVLEPASGAVAALINSNSNEGRNELGSLGGMERLIDVLMNILGRISGEFSSSQSGVNKSSSNNSNLIVLLHNVLHALRYATSSGCERNVSRLLSSSDAVSRIVITIIENGPVLGGGTSAGAVNSDDVTREAVLLLKNIFTSSGEPRAMEMKQSYASDVNFMNKLNEISAKAQAAVAETANSNNNSANDASGLLHRAVVALLGVLES